MASLSGDDIDLEKQLNLVQEEYVKLQDHLADIEIRYQRALAGQKIDDTEDNKVSGGFYTSIFTDSLHTFITSLFNHQLYSDIVFLLRGDARIYGHKLILAAHCQTWGGLELSVIDVIDFSEVRYEVAYAMIRWLYTDDIELDNVDDTFLIELLQIVSKSSLSGLLKRVEKALINHMTSTNYNILYQLASDLSCQLLLEYCLEYMTQNNIDTSVGDTEVLRKQNPELQERTAQASGNCEETCVGSYSLEKHACISEDTQIALTDKHISIKNNSVIQKTRTMWLIV